MGIAPLPRMATEAELRSGQLVALPWMGPEVRISTHLVWNPERHMSPALPAFLMHARETAASGALLAEAPCLLQS